MSHFVDEFLQRKIPSTLELCLVKSLDFPEKITNLRPIECIQQQGRHLYTWSGWYGIRSTQNTTVFIAQHNGHSIS